MKHYFRLTLCGALLLALAIPQSAQSQIGGLVGKKLKEKAEQAIDKALNTDDSKKKDQSMTTEKDSPSQNDQKSKEITADDVIASVPKMPTQQQVADYLCESNKANPRQLKLLANPTTAFLAKLTVSGIGGYASLSSGKGYYDFNEQLLQDLGVSQEQFDAMTEEEQAELARKYAAELEQRYYKTMERLGKDDTYNKMLDKYNALEQKISRLFSDADSVCQAVMEKTGIDGAGVSEEKMCNYYRSVVPDYYMTTIKALNIRKTEQLAVAKHIDEYVKTLADQYPKEIYSGLYSQAAICATSYVTDAARITTLPGPKN